MKKPYRPEDVANRIKVLLELRRMRMPHPPASE
jgi:hypothetical protein